MVPWRALRREPFSSLGIIIGAVVFLVAAPFLLPEYAQGLLVVVLINAVAVMSLTVLMGWSGQPSILTAALLMVGGYAAAAGRHYGVPFVGCAVLAVVAGAVVGALSSMPALRLTGIYLLLSTLAMHVILNDLGGLWEARVGALAGFLMPNPEILGRTVRDARDWIWLSGTLATAVFLYYRFLSRTRLARSWRMIKEDPAAAEVAGLRVGALVVQAFTLTSGITALAGCLLAYYTRDVSYQAFGLLIAINFIVMAVVGGLGSLNGAFAGSLVVTLLPTVLVQLVGQQSLTGPLASRLTYIDLAVYGLIGILLLQFRPGRTGRRIWTWWADRRRSPRKSKGDPAWNFNPTMLVELRGVSVQYAAGEIGLESIDMAVPPRGALAVLGRNGAGKTSLLYAIAGFPAGTGGRVQSGVVVWNRHGSPLRIESQAPEFRATQGIIMVPAEDKVFPQLTVGDHLREALVGRRASDGKVGLTAIFERFPLLRDRQAALAGTLSGGERQQLALAVALAKHARLLLVDEATLGLAPIMVLSVGALLKAIASQEAVSIMVVEQNPEVAFSLANQVILLDDGKIELVGAPSPDLRVQIERSYLGIGGIVGDHPEALEPQVPAKPSLGAALSSRPVVLDVREAGLRIGGVMPLDDVSLALRAGQVVGLVGPNGAGKTSLLNAISGYYQLDRGSIHVSGVEVRGRSPHGVVELGVSRSFQAVGHVADLTVADLVMIGFEASWKTGVVVTYLGLPMGGRAERRARQEATSMLEDSGLLPYSDIRLRDCPYGIRKMADLLRAFAGRPRLLLLDEPTSGVSDTERPEIARLLRQYLDRSGAAALVVDHDVDFVSSLCNELVVLAAGRKIAEGPTKDVLKAVAVRRAFTGRLESDDDAATV